MKYTPVAGERFQHQTMTEGKIHISRADGVSLENVVIDGGMPGEDEAILLQGSKGVRITDTHAYNVQRLIHCAVNGFGGSDTSLVIDGATCRGYRNTMGVTNRSEALLFHGYEDGQDYSLDLEIRNVHITDWPGSSLTLWDLHVTRAIISECSWPTNIDLGFSRPYARYERIEFRDIDTPKKEINYRLYPQTTFEASMVGEIVTPRGWKHVARFGGGSNVKTLGVYDTVEELIEKHAEAA